MKVEPHKLISKLKQYVRTGNVEGYIKTRNVITPEMVKSYNINDTTVAHQRMEDEYAHYVKNDLGTCLQDVLDSLHNEDYDLYSQGRRKLAKWMFGPLKKKINKQKLNSRSRRYEKKYLKKRYKRRRRVQEEKTRKQYSGDIAKLIMLYVQGAFASDATARDHLRKIGKIEDSLFTKKSIHPYLDKFLCQGSAKDGFALSIDAKGGPVLLLGTSRNFHTYQFKRGSECVYVAVTKNAKIIASTTIKHLLATPTS